MFRNQKTLAYAALLSSSANGIYMIGKCPQVDQTWSKVHPDEKLDISKLHGDWYNYYETNVRSLAPSCGRTHFKAVEGQPTMLQQVEAVSFKEDDLVVYSDYHLLNFNHTSDSSLAAQMSIEEL